MNYDKLEDTIKSLMIQVGHPDSLSLKLAFFQLANEIKYTLSKEQKFNGWSNWETYCFWKWIVEGELFKSYCEVIEFQRSVEDLLILLEKDIRVHLKSVDNKLFETFLKMHIYRIDFRQIAEHIALTVESEKM